MKTLDKISIEVAESYGMAWDQLILDKTLINEAVIKVAKLYAKQLLTNAYIPRIDNGIPGTTYADTNYDSESVCYGYNQAVGNSRAKITSLYLLNDLI